MAELTGRATGFGGCLRFGLGQRLVRGRLVVGEGVMSSASSTGTDKQWEQPGAFEVVDGVHRIPMPLPGDGLRAVNVYALEAGGSLVLIDAGWALGNAREQLEAGLAELDHDLSSVRRILVTHIHRDHYELGMEVRRLVGSRLELGEGERPAMDELVDEVDWNDSGLVARLRQAGAQNVLDDVRRLHERREQTHELNVPSWEYPDGWLTDRQILDLPEFRLEVLHTPGHTQGHVVFVDHTRGLLFAGDHILPHITPSIAFERVPRELALGDYLTSLAAVRSLPDHRLLPAHGPVQPATHERIDELLVHHDHRLQLSVAAVGDNDATAYEVASRLPWTRRDWSFAELDPFNQMLAVNETAAHLDLLVRREELAASDHDGIRHYRR